jgi:PAS domain S-box-containing protein
LAKDTVRARAQRPAPTIPDPLFEVLGQARIGLAWITLEGVFLRSNEAFAAQLGLPAPKLQGARIEDLLAPEDQQRVMRPFGRFRRGGPSFTMETRYLKPDGERLWTYQTFVPADDPTDGQRRILAVIHDETYLRHTKKNLRAVNDALESRMRERTAELETTVHELEAYNYSVTHDLRTPLRAIRGFVDLLLRAKTADPQMRTHLEAVAESSRQMTEIIEGLQRLSGMTRAELRRTDVDLSAMVADAIRRLRRENPKRHVDVRIRRGLIARADPELARVLIENLVSNAWKFTRFKRAPRIEFASAERDGRTYFVVRDNGVGFDPADVSKLFHPFRRLHKDSRFEGTGVGLATVRQVVRRHGGRIVAEGSVGKGAAFLFTLSRWEQWT